MMKAYLRQLASLKYWLTRSGRAPAAPYRPRIDSLENRWLPSAYSWVDGVSGTWSNPMNWFNELGQHQGVPGRFDTASISAGTVTIDGDAVAVLSMGAGVTLTGGGSLDVFGALDWAGGSMSGGGTTTINAQAVLTISAPVSLQGWTLVNAGTVNWSGAPVTVGGAQIHNLAGATFNDFGDGVLVTGGGIWTFLNDGLFRKTVDDSGTTRIDAGSVFTNNGTVQVDAGTLQLAGTFTNFSSPATTLTGGSYVIQGALQFNDANVVTNAATVVLDGPAAVILDQFGDNGLTYFADNAAEGNFTLRDGAVFVTFADLDNAGVVLVSDVSQLYVNGNYTQEGGSTTLTGSYVYAAFVDIQGGQLIGWGVVDSSVQSEGEVDVGGLKNPDPTTSTVGTLEITGDYTQAGTAILQIKLGGSQRDRYDHLQVDGQMNLDGTLVVARVNGFQPGFFDEFQILTYGARSGDFAATVPPDGYRFTDYTYDDFRDVLNIALDLAP